MCQPVRFLLLSCLRYLIRDYVVSHEDCGHVTLVYHVMSFFTELTDREKPDNSVIIKVVKEIATVLQS